LHTKWTKLAPPILQTTQFFSVFFLSDPFFGLKKLGRYFFFLLHMGEKSMKPIIVTSTNKLVWRKEWRGVSGIQIRELPETNHGDDITMRLHVVAWLHYISHVVSSPWDWLHVVAWLHYISHVVSSSWDYMWSHGSTTCGNPIAQAGYHT
jgi:hypothetical protein